MQVIICALGYKIISQMIQACISNIAYWIELIKSSFLHQTLLVLWSQKLSQVPVVIDFFFFAKFFYWIKDEFYNVTYE